ncbi:LLM class flavin-dependent oxidoreductase [Catenulispora pinisilvae]|uniref:LLM class flavin-dependent oxidoreductase n=1 Tax=Catenulispora pinisilvae TaxID=2705253 RepID=UPI0018918850|nr:LLM class flavin-dependent oxidoreductase [Catenulispora pinisilvae]
MTDRPALSCTLVPTADVVAQARLAEQLGYRRVWLADAPALYGDLWVAMARIATGTEHIGIGAGVTVPGLRHPMVTASAIASVDELAPGRLIVGLGTGYSALNTLGRKPATWAQTAAYYRQVHALLDGQTIDIDGRACRMMQLPDLQLPGLGARRPIKVPLWLAVSGPKGIATARELAVPGVIWTSTPTEHGDWADSALLRFGTVLDPGEDHTHPRVLKAAGPGYTAMVVHAAWQHSPTAVDHLPGGTKWRERVEQEQPPERRHTIVHEGHIVRLVDRDRDVATAAGPTLLDIGWSGDAASIRDRFTQAADSGVTEVIYIPAGPDIARELTAFASAASLFA